MGLREIESKLPPGFRFYPSDEELVCHYLLKKIGKERVWEGTLVEVDLHTCEPWELPDVARLSANEWYFFSFRDRKYSTGSRTNRATKTGYWKATGKDRVVHDPTSQAVVGMRKTLVFYSGRAPNGMKTNWVMHEFRLETPHMPPKEDWVLCRVLSKRKSEMTSYGQEHENVENYSTNYPSPNILESSSLFGQQTMLTAVNYVDQDPPLTTFLPQIEDNNTNLSNKSPLMALLQYNFLGEMEMEYINRDEDDYGFLIDMGLGENDMTGSSSNHGIGIVCTESNVDMNAC